MPEIPDFSNCSSVAGLGELLNTYLAEVTTYVEGLSATPAEDIDTTPATPAE